MTTDNRGMQPSSSVCDRCPSAYECGKLSCALEVLKAEAKSAQTSFGETSYFQVRAILDNAAFKYPESERACLLAGRRSFIQELTKEVIWIMDGRRGEINGRIRSKAPA